MSAHINYDKYRKPIKHPWLVGWSLLKRIQHVDLALQDLYDVCNKHFTGRFTWDIIQTEEKYGAGGKPVVLPTIEYSVNAIIGDRIPYTLIVKVTGISLLDDENGNFQPAFYINRVIGAKHLGQGSQLVSMHNLVASVDKVLKEDLAIYDNQRLSMSIRQIATNLESI